MTSPLTTTCDALADGVTARLTTAGFPWDRLHKSWERYLGETLGSMTSGHPELTMGRSQTLAALLVALGGSGNALTMSEATLMAGIIDASGGGGGGYSGPMDIMASPIGAWSQRALTSAWTSNALTIRRSSDDTTHSFATTTSNAVDPAAVASFIGGGSGFVASLADQSGNGSDGVQATTDNQPQWLASQSPGNSRPGITFAVAANSAVRLATAANVTLPGTGLTIYVVMKTGQNPGSVYPAFGQGFDTLAGGVVVNGGSFTGSPILCDVGTSDGNSTTQFQYPTSGSSGVADGIHLITYTTDHSSVAKIRVDGAALSPIHDVSFGFTGISELMALGNDDATSGSAPADLWFELLIYGAAHSDGNMALVEANIAAYYGITLS